MYLRNLIIFIYSVSLTDFKFLLNFLLAYSFIIYNKVCGWQSNHVKYNKVIRSDLNKVNYLALIALMALIVLIILIV